MVRFDTGCPCCRDDFYDYEEWLMKNVRLIDHPLVQHKLALMREKNCSTKSFRQLANEIGMLIGYEVMRDLPTEAVEIETPIAKMLAPKLAGKKLVFAPILRAGLALVDGMLDLVPAARVAHIGLYRDPSTLVAVEYYLKTPNDLSVPEYEAVYAYKAAVEKAGKTDANAVLNALPTSFSTPELNVGCAEGEPHRLSAELQQLVAKGQLPSPEHKPEACVIDGLRIDWEDGFGLIRASNTTPVLVLRFEGQTDAALQRIEHDMLSLLRQVKPDAKFQEAAH